MDTTTEHNPNWRVTAQRRTTQPGTNGAYVSGWEVQFETRSGDTGSVFIAQDAYTAQNVARLISDRAAVMTEVRNLQG